VYNNSLATVRHQIEQAEHPTPVIVISTEAASVHNAILSEYLASKVALEEPEIRSTDPNNPKYNNSTHDELHFRTPGGGGKYEDESDQTTSAKNISVWPTWLRQS
jgi:hypothetical protein